MMTKHLRTHVGVISALAMAGACAAGALVACSSSGGGNNNGFGGTHDGGADGTVMTQASCANPTVNIVFSPMYSAYIPGDTTVKFQLPAVTEDGNAATWGLSDPTQGQLQDQMFQDADGNNVPGVMITVTGTGDSAGHVSVIATESDGKCGSAVLNITANTSNDWQIGNQRYNDGVSIHFGPPSGFDGGRPEGGMGGGGGFSSDGGSFFEADGGTACTNCHGPTAMNGPFKDVSHTPEQTAGFSDTDLENIILNGVIPDGGYFDPTVVRPSCDGGAACTAQAYAFWQKLHRWNDIQPDQLPGIICYLRSITPAPQNGMSNFGGHHHDGGMPPMPPANDSGTTPPVVDAGAGD